MMACLVLCSEVPGRPPDPSPELALAASVLASIHRGLLEELFLFFIRLVVVVLRQRDLRMVQVEGRRLGPNTRNRGEVVPRRWAGSGPLQRTTPAPRIVGGDLRIVPGLPDVVEERQARGAEEKGSGGRDLVEDCESLVRQVVRVPSGHTLHAQPVLQEKRGVEADEEQPEVDLPPGLVEHAAGELWPPEIEPGEHREDDSAEDHVVEVGHDEVAVVELEVQRWAGQDHAGQTTKEKGDQESDRP